MGTRTVRLDPDAEATLDDVCERTGLSVSEVIRRGVAAYAEALDQARETPYEIISRYDLGREGTQLHRPSRPSRQLPG